MDFNDSPEEASFREECKSFLAASTTPKRLDQQTSIADLPLEEALAKAKAWQKLKADAGFACIQWPE